VDYYCWGIVLSRARMQKRLFRGPAVRARDIIGAGRVCTGIQIPVECVYSTAHTYTRRQTASALARVAVVGNYSGQLDIPRAYKHARTHTDVGVPPIRSPITLALPRSPIAREIRSRASGTPTTSRAGQTDSAVCGFIGDVDG